MDIPSLYVPSEVSSTESFRSLEIGSIIITEENRRLQNLLRKHATDSNDLTLLTKAASQLVYDTLNSAIDICLMFNGMDKSQPIELCVFDPDCEREVNACTAEEILAATIRTVTRQLHEFIQKWVRQVPLKCVIQLVRSWRSPEGDWDTYVFEAKFSLPTRRFPTPQCTASVYFIFDVPDIDRSAQESMVMVKYRYQFEGMFYLHEPHTEAKNFDFQEKLLMDILKHKSALFRRLPF